VYTLGSHLGPYEIVELIGEGGMGVVFKARDTRLNRTVAIKVPKEPLSPRFDREARAVAALNHPHICTLYDIGPDYLVMEYVDGQPMKGPLSIAAAVRFGVQIATALEAAHRYGITHRDLKPANILVARSGIKLLDFGLAKTAEDALGVRQVSAKFTIVGTLQYMSPEQVEGNPVDSRTDIFGFGAVLYEMLTGKRAFDGSSEASVMAAILKEHPKPLHEAVPLAPPALERVIGTCLAKDPDDRFQTARDLRRQLEWIANDLEKAAPEQRERSRTRSWIMEGSIAIVLLALMAGIAEMSRTAPVAGSFDAVPLTSYPGLEREPALSPDGKLVAFTWTGADFGKRQVYVKQLDSSQPLAITHGPAEYSDPAWSPEGHQLAIERHEGPGGTAVVVIPALGGPEREANRIPGSTGEGECWLGRNAVVVSACMRGAWGCDLVAVPLDRGRLKTLTSAPGRQRDIFPAVSPDGSTLAFARTGDVNNSHDEIMLLPLDRNQEPAGPLRKLPAAVQAVHGLAWAPDGKSLFISALRNGAHRLARVAISGDGSAEAVAVGTSGTGALSVSGRRMAFVWEQHDTDIYRVAGPAWSSAPAPEPQAIVASTYDDAAPNVSPDGKRIAFASEASGSQEIWVADADGRNGAPITNFNGAPVGTPRWSPDGTQIAFDSRKYGAGDIFIVSASGGAPMRLTTEPSTENQPVWSSDGGVIFFASNRTGRFEIWKAPSGGGPAIQVSTAGGRNARTLDGSLYYLGVGNPYLWRMPESGGEPEKITDGVSNGSWTPYRGGIARYSSKALEIKANGAKDWTAIRKMPPDLSPRFIIIPVLSLSPDDRWAYVSLTTLDRADLLMIENIR
jgi:Tol biopolymer transport system component/predicted Ser/Thr protein kinase